VKEIGSKEGFLQTLAGGVEDIVLNKSD